MSTPRFFGYGSLVNRATHTYPDARAARLVGWRRVWRHATLRPVAFLSVEPAVGVTIDGLVAEVPNADWAALDAREFAYCREDVTGQVSHDGPPSPTAVYRVDAAYLGPANNSFPILLSYLDVVVQGFAHVYGRDGVDRFFETTAGWEAPIRDDRAAPVYPRAQALSREESALVDAWIKRLGVRLID